MNFFDGKRILVTGCCGTIGSELLFQLLETCNAEEVIGIDNTNVNCSLSNNEQAFKHVVLCERSPFEAVSNNITAAENIIRAARECGINA